MMLLTVDLTNALSEFCSVTPMDRSVLDLLQLALIMYIYGRLKELIYSRRSMTK